MRLTIVFRSPSHHSVIYLSSLHPSQPNSFLDTGFRKDNTVSSSLMELIRTHPKIVLLDLLDWARTRRLPFNNASSRASHHLLDSFTMRRVDVFCAVRTSCIKVLSKYNRNLEGVEPVVVESTGTGLTQMGN